MLVRDGVIEKMFIEPEEPGDPYGVSDADTMLQYLDPNGALPYDVTVFSREGCPFCAKAKAMLDEAGIEFEELVLNQDYTDQTLRAVTNANNVSTGLYQRTPYRWIRRSGSLVRGALTRPCQRRCLAGSPAGRHRGPILASLGPGHAYTLRMLRISDNAPDSQQHRVFEKARLSRDPRFDGRFFVGVKTTGIYCRPICPANAPNSANVSFYPTAAAAGEAGYRPCLRCRPECAPGTPAWQGTSTTVKRGLRLIADGALDDGDIEALADRLGVTSRHLRRLFKQHIGASPVAVAHTQRLHFAKRLIDQTTLPMTEIALAAGFGSTRRFNDAFRNTYGKTPRELRKRKAVAKPAAGLTVELPYRSPFDFSRLLAFFATRAIPGVEVVDGERYLRSVEIDGASSIIEFRWRRYAADDRARWPHAVAAAGHPACTWNVRPRCFARRYQPRSCRKTRFSNGACDVTRAFVSRASGTDSNLRSGPYSASSLRRGGYDPVGPPGTPLWHGRRLERLWYHECADTGLSRTGEVVAGAVGRPRNHRSRAGTIRRVAKAVVEGSVSFDSGQDADEFCRSLVAIKGIGDWTAQYIAMRALKEPDAFPHSDLGLLRAFDAPGSPRIKPAELKEPGRGMAPWRAYAALLLWGSEGELRRIAKCTTVTFDTPIGELLLAGTESALAMIGFPKGAMRRDPEPDWIYNEAPFQAVMTQLREYFDGSRKTFDLPLELTGTEFQVSVLKALQGIPYGETTSYGSIARQIGRPKAVRAVGAANGRNPIPIIVPCHRVIGSSGDLTGFGGGLDTKAELLRLEAENSGTLL